MLLRLVRTHLRALPHAGSRRRRPAVRRHGGRALPAQPQRRHHRQGRRHRRHRLHPAHRRGDARRSRCCRSSARSPRSGSRRPHRDELRPRRARRRSSTGSAPSPQREVQHFGAPSLITRDHQRRPAGADARADELHPDGRRADHDGRRHHHGACARTSGCPGCSPSWCPCSSSRIGFIVRRMVPQLPGDADAHRQGQPGAARADHRHPGGARLRPRAATRRERFADANGDLTAVAVRAGRWHGRRCSRRVMLVAQRLQRRGALVRRPPRRRAGRCRSVR